MCCGGGNFQDYVCSPNRARGARSKSNGAETARDLVVHLERLMAGVWGGEVFVPVVADKLAEKTVSGHH